MGDLFITCWPVMVSVVRYQ